MGVVGQALAKHVILTIQCFSLPEFLDLLLVWEKHVSGKLSGTEQSRVLSGLNTGPTLKYTREA